MGDRPGLVVRPVWITIVHYRDHHSAAAFLLRALERAIERLRPDLLDQVIPPELALEPDAVRVSTRRLHAAWSNAEQLLGPDVGLLSAGALDIAELDPYGVAMNAAGTVQDALDLVRRYHTLLHSSLGVSVEQRAGAVTLRLQHPRDADVPQALVEFAAAALWRLARHVFPALRLSTARLPRASAASDELRRATFGGRLCSADGGVALVLPAGSLAHANRLADAEVGGVLAQHLQRELGALDSPAPFGAAVRALLVRQMPTGATSAVEIARTLGMSERTLRRRLDGEGASHRQLLEEARRAGAVGLLGRHGLSIDEVAFRLGYAQSSSFQRAFKHWTGMPPATFRARCRRAATGSQVASRSRRGLVCVAHDA
jgi:AraC-like DNA-binding protein